MKVKPSIKVKKLALSYKTGWEYMPYSQEGGSVLTDIFLNMMQENQRRYDGIGEKHRQEFLSVMPPQEKEARRLKTGLAVRASGGSHGETLVRETETYMVPEQGNMRRFVLQKDIRLTAAKLMYAVYQKGLCAWLTYDGGTDKGPDAFEIPLFQAVGEELSHPVFCWNFPDLCNGKAFVDYVLEWEAEGDEDPNWEDGVLPGIWEIGDGTHSYPLEWSRSEGRCKLSGPTPAFAKNLEETCYELRLEIPAGEEADISWLKALSREISLWEAGEHREAQLCLTAAGACGGEHLLPFTDAPEAGMCCYLACDSVLAQRGREVTLRYMGHYETEEHTPPETPKEYAKLYRKYPWLRSGETVREWRVRETCWEYFDGNFWRRLPENEERAAGDRERAAGDRNPAAGDGNGEAGERFHRWKIPQDMQPCSVEGEEHFYIRLRTVKVDNAYAAYYRKEIPVLEQVCFEAKGRGVKPESGKLPEIREAEQTKMYLGFDRDITCDNRWHTGSECFDFTPDQIIGRKVLFEREAFWAELEVGDPMTLPALYANYVEILSFSETGEAEDLDPRLPMGTVFHVETKKAGVLDAVSVCDARYDGRGTVLWQEEQWRESYPAGFGRVMSVMDIELLLSKSYPFFGVCSCQYAEEKRELTVVLEPHKDSEKECDRAMQLQNLLPEIGEWLEEVLRRMGPLSLRDCHVRCLERDKEGA